MVFTLNKQLLEQEDALDLQDIFNCMPGSYAILKPNFPRYTVIAVSNDYLSLSNATREITVGKDFAEVFANSIKAVAITGEAELSQSLLTAAREKLSHTMPVQQSRVINEDGSVTNRYWRCKNVPVFGKDGNLTCFIHHITDITTDIEAQKDCHHLDLDEHAHELFMQAPVAISIFHGDGNIIQLSNDRMLELWGKNADVVGKPAIEVLPEFSAQGFIELLDSVRRTGEPYYAYETIVLLTRQGREKTVYANFVYQPFYQAAGRISGVIMIANDVTEQVVARKRVEESERQFKQIADSMPQMVWTARPNGYVDYYNKQWYQFTGFKEGYGDQSWIPILHPDDVKACYETWYNSVTTGQEYHIEYRFKDRTTGDYRWFLGKALPIKDEQGNIIKWFGTCTDIHDQKLQAEELEEKVNIRTLELQDKNRELAQFAQVSSHDLQEPLRKILIYTDMIKNDYENSLSDRSKKNIEKVSEASLRMANSLRELLNYTSLEKNDQFTLVDLNEVVRNVTHDLELVINKKKAAVHVDVLPSIRAIALQMHQLFYNLLNNALKFSRTDVSPVIQISVRNVDVSYLTRIPLFNPEKEYIEIVVKDNGIGFEQKYADQIFVIFQRLNDRSQFEGTGIGLSLCKKVVDNHGGAIFASGTPNEGASFSVVLPRG